MVSLSVLPTELLLLIVQQLDLPSLLNLCVTSKQWRELVLLHNASITAAIGARNHPSLQRMVNYFVAAHERKMAGELLARLVKTMMLLDSGTKSYPVSIHGLNLTVKVQGQTQNGLDRLADTPVRYLTELLEKELPDLDWDAEFDEELRRRILELLHKEIAGVPIRGLVLLHYLTGVDRHAKQFMGMKLVTRESLDNFVRRSRSPSDSLRLLYTPSHEIAWLLMCCCIYPELVQCGSTKLHAGEIFYCSVFGPDARSFIDLRRRWLAEGENGASFEEHFICTQSSWEHCREAYVPESSVTLGTLDIIVDAENVSQA